MSYSFGGNTNRIDFGSPSQLDNLTAFTVSAWVYQTDNNGGSSGYGRIVEKAGGWLFPFNSGGGFAVEMVYSTTNSNRISSSSLLSVNTWAHVCATWAGSTPSTDLALYVNGSEATYSSSTAGVGTKADDSAGNLVVGNRTDAARGFAGRIAEPAVYGVVLSADEIASLAKGIAPRRVRPQSLVFYGPLVRGSTDLRYGEAGTVTGATVADHPRVY